MRVDNTPQVSGNRNSVRIQTQFTFNGGLIIMDSVHMPTGCGTWPAFWTNGANWPVTGEIDIVEGVNDYTNNQVTIHANTGCQLPTSNVTALGISGSVIGGTNCAALQTNNEGCGVRASQTNSFGQPFNNNGGGVYSSMFFFAISGLITFWGLLMDKPYFGSALGQLGGLCLVLPQAEHPVRHHREGTRSFGLGYTHGFRPCKWLQPIPVLPRTQCNLRHYLMRRLGGFCMDVDWCSRPRPELRPTDGRRDVPAVRAAEWHGTLRSMCVLSHFVCPSV